MWFIGSCGNAFRITGPYEGNAHRSLMLLQGINNMDFALFVICWTSCWMDSQVSSDLRRHDTQVMSLYWFVNMLCKFFSMHTSILNNSYHHILIYFKTPIWNTIYNNGIYSLIARFMGPTWGPPGADRTQVGHMWATWTFLSGLFTYFGL